MARSFAYAPVRTAAPSAAPVTLEQAKAHLRVRNNAEDAEITLRIQAATAFLDGWSGLLGRAIVTQTWVQTFAGFSERLRLPLEAVTVSSVVYDGVTLASDQYTLRCDALGSFIEPVTAWPTGNEVAVTFTSGAAVADVSADIKALILLIVGDLHKVREGSITGETVAETQTIKSMLAKSAKVTL